MELPFAESWRIKMVEPIRTSTRQEREEWIKAAHEHHIECTVQARQTVNCTTMLPLRKMRPSIVGVCVR